MSGQTLHIIREWLFHSKNCANIAILCLKMAAWLTGRKKTACHFVPTESLPSYRKAAKRQIIEINKFSPLLGFEPWSSPVASCQSEVRRSSFWPFSAFSQYRCQAQFLLQNRHSLIINAAMMLLLVKCYGNKTTLIGTERKLLLCTNKSLNKRQTKAQ